MKISKVEHVKTGVGFVGNNVSGILYRNPGKAEEPKDLEEHIRSRNRSAKNLYAVFNPLKEANKKSSCSDLHKFFNSKIGGMLKNQSEQQQVSSLLHLKYDNKDDASVSVEEICNSVDLCLRNSLRKSCSVDSVNTKVYIPNVVKKIMCSFYDKRGYTVACRDIPAAEIHAFLRLLNEDYQKEKQIKDIKGSIEKQNVKVQTYKDENSNAVRLCLSNAAHKTKGAVFEFLREYAAGDVAEREKLLLHFRQLLILFYLGKDMWRDSRKNLRSVWNFSYYTEDRDCMFHPGVAERILERNHMENKAERRAVNDEIREILRSEIFGRYLRSVEVKGQLKTDKFWLQFIKERAERILLSKTLVDTHKLSVRYLCDETWKEWIAFIGMKYVDMGKAVYHFAMPDLQNLNADRENGMVIGDVLPAYRSGLTSFDYEMIKANETLERDLSLYAAFAVNAFANAMHTPEVLGRPGNEDVLLMRYRTNSKTGETAPDMGKVRSDARNRIFRFFGGSSQWIGSDIHTVKDEQLYDIFQKSIALVRNSSFHYTANPGQLSVDAAKTICILFEKEYGELGSVYRKKYDSNNVRSFYAEKHVTKLMDFLYDKEKERPAQIPAFGRILSKRDMPEFIRRFIHGESRTGLEKKQAENENVSEMFRSTLYFLLKEIYYFGFLQDRYVSRRFSDALREIRQTADKKDWFATDNFCKRIKEITDNIKDGNNGKYTTLGMICQQIMTDYEQQNSAVSKNKSSGSAKDEKIYQHMKLLLYKTIRKAFEAYLLDERWKEKFGFLREPFFTNTDQGNWSSTWEAKTFSGLKKEMCENTDSLLFSWYVTAHFMTTKQINLLTGSIKNYCQYVRDIIRRARETGNDWETYQKTLERKVERYKKILRVLEFVMLFCGRLTQEKEDYFGDGKDNAEEAYAVYLSQYVEFSDAAMSPKDALIQFCSQPSGIRSPETVGLYYDSQNPRLNRNIIFASMYGSEKLLSKTWKKVTYGEIQNYYRLAEKLSSAFKRGYCKNAEEQKEYKEYQNLKNRTELTDVMVFSELVNDLMGQMISWAYLRERDMMYLQLGFHYIRLFWTERVEQDSPLRVLKGKKICVSDGAILYQIAAMYTYGLKVYKKGEEGKAEIAADGGSTTGKKVSAFVNDYCQGKKDIYDAGLCFFENLKRHEEIVTFRNYLDHFKYFSGQEISIMEMYSFIFDQFFTYDRKLKKSVTYILKNILMRYFVKTETVLTKREINGKTSANMELKDVKSDLFTYKAGENAEQEVKVAARNAAFLERVKSILEYKNVNYAAQD